MSNTTSTTTPATVTFAPFETPIGALLLAATADGLVRVGFACEGLDAVRADVRERLGAEETDDWAETTSAAAAQLGAYFASVRKSFTVPLDWSLTSGFRASVQKGLNDIAFGHTESYGELADRLGSPNAVRAVGSACATNPLPIIVPCHRVVRSDGSLGGYLGGLEAKRQLLELEQG